MCGIGGFARVDGGDLDATADPLLERLADALAHRGPDDRELLRSGPVGLAFTRLSLVDPAGGGQPLSTEDGSLVLIVNGEIYNHRELATQLPTDVRLRTRSDCEVLLYLYREHGVHFLDQVRGMFGLVLWDRTRNELVFARDRFGIKPLYYHQNRSRVIFGSEMTSLFVDAETPRRLDWAATLTTPLLPAAPYLTEGSPTTWFEGIRSVEAGTIERIDLRDGSTRRHTYWHFPGTLADPPPTAEAFVAAYGEALARSVAECATADAELGLFLSGGIDSAAVAALAAPAVRELHTFTVLSASTYRAGDAEHAHRLADKLGLINHQVVFDDQRVPTVDEWRRLVWLVETPLCGPEVYYKHELHRYAKMTRPELRGMLLGAASDEFNGGYAPSTAEGGDWAAFVDNVRTMARDSALRARPDLMPWWSYGNRWLLRDDVIRTVAGQSIDDWYPAYLRWQYQKIQQYNVWHEDRTAAGSGIEARVPFLDQRVVELSANVPAALRQELLWDKQILRRAMRGVLPDETVDRPKGPFFYSSGLDHSYSRMLRMLARDDAALVEQALSAPGIDTVIDGPALRAALAELASTPDSPQVEIVLRMVNLGLLAAMVADLPRPTVVTPIGAPPSSVVVSDWDGQAEDLERLVGLRPPLDPHDVPRLNDGVLLLHPPGDQGRIYIAVDGSIEWVLDGDDPRLLAILRGIDGSRTLGEVLADLEVTVLDTYDQVRELLDQRLIVLAPTAGPVPDREGAGGRG